MIEVTLISAAEGSKVGRFVSRKRADLERLGVNKNQFIHGFLKDNLGEIETILHNPDLVELINSDTLLNNKDIASIKYVLSTVGYQMLVGFVADDELNSVSIPVGEVEYDIVDSSWIQEDMSVITKESVAVGTSLTKVLKSIVNNSGFFSPDKLTGVNNPLKGLVNQAEDDEKTLGTPSPALISRLYSVLESLGYTIYAIMGE